MKYRGLDAGLRGLRQPGAVAVQLAAAPGGRQRQGDGRRPGVRHGPQLAPRVRATPPPQRHAQRCGGANGEQFLTFDPPLSALRPCCRNVEPTLRKVESGRLFFKPSFSGPSVFKWLFNFPVLPEHRIKPLNRPVFDKVDSTLDLLKMVNISHTEQRDPKRGMRSTYYK